MRRVLILLLVLCLMGTAGAENHPTLTIGSKGAQVRQLQQRLSDLGVLDGAVDGAYGKQTAASVRTAQQWLIKQGHELAADGAAGPVTLQLLYDDEVMAELLAFRSGDRGARVIPIGTTSKPHFAKKPGCRRPIVHVPMPPMETPERWMRIGSMLKPRDISSITR